MIGGRGRGRAGVVAVSEHILQACIRKLQLGDFVLSGGGVGYPAVGKTQSRLQMLPVVICDLDGADPGRVVCRKGTPGVQRRTPQRPQQDSAERKNNLSHNESLLRILTLRDNSFPEGENPAFLSVLPGLHNFLQRLKLLYISSSPSSMSFVKLKRLEKIDILILEGSLIALYSE